jgi:hypothetical protein
LSGLYLGEEDPEEPQDPAALRDQGTQDRILCIRWPKFENQIYSTLSIQGGIRDKRKAGYTGLPSTSFPFYKTGLTVECYYHLCFPPLTVAPDPL